MSSVLSAPQVLDREFLELRAKVLELAAALDRIDRADGSAADDPRLAKLHEGIDLLQAKSSDRAEQVQLLFSRPYDDGWPENLGVNLPG